mmetsp:Transcript_56063/g.119360  ORF Transcript_56063/g.119360 Transcript_56063/m.119360 type:complete len:274 (-) Transcript_56063:1823-2644(-)
MSAFADLHHVVAVASLEVHVFVFAIVVVADSLHSRNCWYSHVVRKVPNVEKPVLELQSNFQVPLFQTEALAVQIKFDPGRFIGHRPIVLALHLLLRVPEGREPTPKNPLGLTFEGAVPVVAHELRPIHVPEPLALQKFAFWLGCFLIALDRERSCNVVRFNPMQIDATLEHVVSLVSKVVAPRIAQEPVVCAIVLAPAYSDHGVTVLSRFLLACEDWMLLPIPQLEFVGNSVADVHRPILVDVSLNVEDSVRGGELVGLDPEYSRWDRKATTF